MKSLPIVLCLICIVCWLPASATAAAVPDREAPMLVAQATPAGQPKPDEKADKPINITANFMEADDQQKVVIFSGNVVARQDDVVINSDLMRVYYREVSRRPAQPTRTAAGDQDAESETENEIERIELEGNVKITRGNRVAMSNNAVYMAKAKPRVIILTGDPRLWRNKDVLTGKRITVFMDDDRSIVEGGQQQRVNATFYEKSEPTAPNAGGGQP